MKILKGDIVAAKVDAIVLPANTKLKEGSGASTAIFKAAGRKELTKACNRIGNCEVGSAVPTLGYDLPAKYIIHAVVPVWIDGEHDEYDLLSTTYASALELADVMECKIIAFPLLASGNNGYDIELALEIALKSIEAYEAKNLECVSIVIFGSHASDIVKSKGLQVTLLPRNLEKDEQEKAHFLARKKMIQEAKDVTQQFMDEQIQKGVDYFKDLKHREDAVQFGIKIVQMVMKQ